MKNTSKALVSLQEALRNLGNDNALQTARNHIFLAVEEVNRIQGKRAGRLTRIEAAKAQAKKIQEEWFEKIKESAKKGSLET